MVRLCLYRAHRHQQPWHPAAETKAIAAPITTFLLAVALSAIGLDSDLRKLKAKGLKPLALGGVATVVASVGAYGLVSLV